MFLAFAFFEQLSVLAIKFHLDFLEFGGDHMCWNIGKVLLNLDHFLQRETWCTGLVIHLEVFYLLKLAWLQPLHCFLFFSSSCRFLRFGGLVRVGAKFRVVPSLACWWLVVSVTGKERI